MTIARRLANWAQTRGGLPPLPEPFIFGVGSADHQVEAYDSRYEDIRDWWEREKEQTLRGRATEFWDRYPEDVALARALGCKAFRLSVAWSRVEPTPGQFNDEAFNKYRDILDAIRAAGMEPIVTLHHFTWPLHIEERGGMTSEQFPAWFERYAAEVVSRLGRGVRYWITFNEPSMLPYGFLKPWWVEDYFAPPGLPDGLTLSDKMDIVGRFIRNLFLAHTAARAAIQRVEPEAKVGVNPVLLGLPPWLQRWIDRNITRLRSREDWVKSEPLAERRWLEQGEVDVVLATLTVSRERAEQVAFSEVYFVAGQTLMVKADSALNILGDLAGQGVAVVKSSTAERALTALIPAARAVIVADHAAALKALEGGSAAAVMSDDTILLGLMARSSNRYRLMGGRLTEEPYAAAVAKGDPGWLELVNAAVRDFMESGAFAENYARHFPGQPIPEPPRRGRLTLTGLNRMPPPTRAAATPSRTLERIRKRGHLIVAVKDNVSGFGYRHPQSGEWSGLEIDLARALAQAIFGDAGKVKFRPATTQKRIPLLRSLWRFLDPVIKPYGILSTVLTTNWWHLGMAGKLPEFLCPLECVGKQDFVGFDYYWGVSSLQVLRVQRLFNAIAASQYSQATVWPEALYGMLKYHAELLPGKEILIVENGCVDVADGVDRVTYLREHIKQVQRARREGVNVIGYICWCITSNREWGAPFNADSDFGLYHIDLDTDPELKRTPTAAAEVYRQIIARRGV